MCACSIKKKKCKAVNNAVYLPLSINYHIFSHTHRQLYPLADKGVCIHGSAVNVPVNLDSLVETLSNQSEFVSLKFKKKLSYKGHYNYVGVCSLNRFSLHYLG